MSSEAASEPRAVTRLKCDCHWGDEGRGRPGSSSWWAGCAATLKRKCQRSSKFGEGRRRVQLGAMDFEGPEVRYSGYSRLPD